MGIGRFIGEMEMQLTDNEKERLLKCSPGPGHRHFTCCPLCGYLEWRMTQKDQLEDVTVQEDTMGRGCPRCQEVLHRDPEIFQWVLAVLGYRDAKGER